MATTSGTAKKTASASTAKVAVSATATAKKPVAAKAAAPKKPAAKRAAKSAITPEQRYCMVAEAAYFHAERHGFLGDPVQDWIAAEAEIAALLSKK